MLNSAANPVKTITDYKLVPFGGGLAADARDLAALHEELLPRSPLTKVGRRFMESFYYNCLPKQGAIFGAIAYVNAQPAGFVSATYDSNNFMVRAFRRNFYRLVWLGLTTLPTPSRIEGAFEAAGIMKYREGREKRDGTEFVGEILSIGVREQFRGGLFKAGTGLHIGRDLLMGAMDGFRKSKITRAPSTWRA